MRQYIGQRAQWAEENCTRESYRRQARAKVLASDYDHAARDARKAVALHTMQYYRTLASESHTSQLLNIVFLNHVGMQGCNSQTNRCQVSGPTHVHVYTALRQYI